MHGGSSHVREEQQVGTSCSGCKFLCRPASSRHTHATTLSSCCCSCTPLQFGCCCHQTSCCCCKDQDQDSHVFIMILALHFFLPFGWFFFFFFFFFLAISSLCLCLSFFSSFRSLPTSVYQFSTSVLSVLLDSGDPVSSFFANIEIYI